MKPWLAALPWTILALASAVEAGDAVVVVQETRTPVVNRKHTSVQHVVLLKNVSPHHVRGLRVTVEFYDFFDKLLLVRSGTPVPSSLAPGDTATLSVPTPVLESLRKTRYRFQHGGGSQPHARPRPRRGRRVPAGRRRPNSLDLAPS